LLLAACASGPDAASRHGSMEEKHAMPAAAPTLANPADKPQTVMSSQSGLVAASREWADQLQELRKKSVYFDFDESSVKSEYMDAERHQIEWMKTHGNDTVTLEGNADERGSDEYNLALGSRRADAIRKALVLSGISSDRINVVSYGEEKPRAACHEEKCWQENRRVDFVHKLN
jgi:peptidoglycan-associated lipoprotein